MNTKTKTHKTMKLPKGLPKLPPVPSGFRAWEYMGKGWRSNGPVGSPWGVTMGTHDLAGWFGALTGKLLGPEEECNGAPSNHYIRAIKHPAPAKKQPKAKAVKANLAYAKYTDHGALVAVSLNPHNKFCKTRVRIIDISNPDALALQAAAAIDALPRRSTKGDCARAVLESLGIIPKRKAK